MIGVHGQHQVHGTQFVGLNLRCDVVRGVQSVGAQGTCGARVDPVADFAVADGPGADLDLGDVCLTQGVFQHVLGHR